MNERLKDILSNLHSEVDQEELLRYLEGHLAPEQQQELEAQLLDNDFEAEALEGLQALPDQKKIAGLVEGLNRDLRKKTEKRQARRKAPLQLEPWLLITIALILLLAIIGFVIIKMKSGE
ncbi:hypothetical protein [Flaviaesturariibacter amylovorans]|uniref:Uncharacterized protein n=1 Tax=Flaviaesturariibacter amylovorans TaxID=1084520 RepID=A0ABP8GGA8_9BACT